MKTTRWFLLLVSLAMAAGAQAADGPAESTRALVGQPAPGFSCRTLSGTDFSLADQKGKVVLINFFATWCGPCMEEMPHLEKEVFQQFKGRTNFVVLAIGREHGAEELEKFRKSKGFVLPMAPDPKREVYGKYAAQYIPRNFLVGRDGTIKLASTGYTQEEFKALIELIRKELGE